MDSTKPNNNVHEQLYQNVVVMRHGDRLDNFDPHWASKAARPWDPPLIDDGLSRAFVAGSKLRAQLGFPIHRVLVSPFLRCIQTASQVIAALCAAQDDPNAVSSNDAVSIDQSKLKVSIEYGLCEMLNREAIRLDLAPHNGDFGFNISDLQAMFPAGTVEHTAEPVYKELPQWEETVMGARDRYVRIIKALADKYPSENLLLVTHGEGVGTAVSAFLKNTTVYQVDYCAYAELRRPIFCTSKSNTAGEFEVLTSNGQNGIGYISSNTMSDDPVITGQPF